MGVTRKKTMRKRSPKKLAKQNTVFVYVERFPVEETLFPEKLKKANELLARAKMMD